MFKRVLIALVFVVVLATVAVSSDAGLSWNSHAAQYNFDTYPMAAHATFYDSYNGSDFSADFAGIKAEVEDDLMMVLPPSAGDDLASATITSWSER